MKTMKSFLTIMAFGCCFVLFFSSCSKEKRFRSRIVATWSLAEKSTNGTPASQEELSVTFTFDKVGTFQSDSSGVTKSGNWKIEGDILTIYPSNTAGNVAGNNGFELYQILKLDKKNLQLENKQNGKNIRLSYNKTVNSDL